MLRTFVLAALASVAVAGLYSTADGVYPLTDDNYVKTVGGGANVWLIEVYADWCGHCKAAVPAVKAAAKALAGIAKVGVVDGDKGQATASKLGVTGFPTFKLVVDDKSKPIDYNGPREAAALVEFVTSEMAKLAKRRLSGKAGSSSSRASGGSTGSKPSGTKSGSGNKAVVTGTAANFEKEVLQAEEPVLVEFFAPWCGHCKSLAGPLEEAAAELKGDVKVVAVDATEESSLAAEYGVRGYPTLKFFPAGAKTAAMAKEYQGGRTKDDIVSTLQAMSAASGGVALAKVAQLTSPQQWEEECSGKRVCVVAVLPHILDDQATKRNARLETLQAIASKVGKRSFVRFLWTEIGAQPKLEEALNVGMAPAIFAVRSARACHTHARAPALIHSVHGCASLHGRCR